MFTGRWLRGRESQHSVEDKEKEIREGKGKGRGIGKSQRSNPEFNAALCEFEEMEYNKRLKERDERIEREHQRKLRFLEHSACTYGTPIQYTPMKYMKGDEQGEYEDEAPAIFMVDMKKIQTLLRKHLPIYIYTEGVCRCIYM